MFQAYCLSTKILERARNCKVFCGMEFSPPKGEKELDKLLKSVALLEQSCQPLFRSVSCHWSHSTVLEAAAVRLARALGNEERTVLHLATATLTKTEVKFLLDEAKAIGIRSVFALRGDERYSGEGQPQFNFAIDLVKFIKDNYGDYFTIFVAGYPLKHPEALSYDQDLLHLKQKVDAGADIIITQITFDTESFVKFVQDCRNVDIHIPILPAVIAFKDYVSLKHMSHLCKFEIPEDMTAVLEPIQHDQQAVREFGVTRTVNMLQELLRLKVTPGFHIITMNSEEVPLQICRQLGLCSEDSSS